MEIQELAERLLPFCRTMYGDDSVQVSDVHKMPGHAGFAYGFTAESATGRESWFLRLPPPNVKWEGTADVLKQAVILKALDRTDVPHCPLKWSGDDLQWFGRPYFIVPVLEGDVLRLQEGEWGSSLSEETIYSLGEQVARALAGVHRLDWQTQTPSLGPPFPFDDDILRWDRFYGRFADPERLARLPEVRQRLLDNAPGDATVGLFHGDFQTANFFCSRQGELLAIIDWELAGVGAILNDLGWYITFSDPEAWSTEDVTRHRLFLDPETIIDQYTRASGTRPAHLNWFRALGAYKFAIITGFNLGLHRRGKRHDPLWESIGFSMNTLVDRALDLLG